MLRSLLRARGYDTTLREPEGAGVGAYDLALVDLSVQEGLLPRLSELPPSLPILYLVPGSQVISRVEAELMHATVILRLPLSIDELDRALQTVEAGITASRSAGRLTLWRRRPSPC